MKSILIFIFAAISIFAQNGDPKLILDLIKNKFDEVNDYQADVLVKLDIDFLKVPETKAEIYYKKPDKIHFDSEGFAMLPRQVFAITPSRMLSFDYTPIYIRDEDLNGVNTVVIKIIPNNDTANMLLSTVWIDVANSRVQKIETVTKQVGTITTILSYDRNNEYPLPDSVIVQFDSNAQTQTVLSNNQNSIIQNKRAVIGGRQLNGSVTLIYSNYKINEGIPNSVFEKREK